MKNPITKQMVVTGQSGINSNQLVESVALFDEAGAPVVLGGGGSLGSFSYTYYGQMSDPNDASPINTPITVGPGDFGFGAVPLTIPTDPTSPLTNGGFHYVSSGIAPTVVNGPSGDFLILPPGLWTISLACTVTPGFDSFALNVGAGIVDGLSDVNVNLECAPGDILYHTASQTWTGRVVTSGAAAIAWGHNEVTPLAVGAFVLTAVKLAN